MNKMFLIKNPDLFQGKKYLNKKKNYFEGWYFKNTNKEKGSCNLNIKSVYNTGLKLFAAVKGKMEKDIFESISISITVTLKRNNTVIFCDTSKNCGLEINVIS